MALQVRPDGEVSVLVNQVGPDGEARRHPPGR
jgi:hypothetical protein